MLAEIKFKPIAIDFDNEWTPRSLDECVAELPIVARACLNLPTLANTITACDWGRSGWAAYLQHWGEELSFPKHKQLRVGLRHCYDAVAKAAREASGEEKGVIGHYAANIFFRIRLLDILLSQGEAAAKAEMDLHTKQLRSQRSLPHDQKAFAS